MKEELQKQRDELAEKYYQERPDGFGEPRSDFSVGFDDCHAIMSKDIESLQSKLDAAKKALENLEGHTIAHLQFPHKDTSNLTLALLAARQALKEME